MNKKTNGCGSFLSLEFGYTLSESRYLSLSITLLLSLKLYDLSWRIGHETLIAEFFLHTGKEALKVFKISFHLLYLSLGIDEIAETDCIFGSAKHEGRSAVALGIYV